MSTTRSKPFQTNITIKHECYDNWFLFRDGLTICQAQTENPQVAPFNIRLNTYSYLDINLMSGEMCASSCLKYGFAYAAITP